jgi:hypothetical protein
MRLLLLLVLRLEQRPWPQGLWLQEGRQLQRQTRAAG